MPKKLRKLRKLSNLKKLTGGAALVLTGIALAGAFAAPALPVTSTPSHATTLDVQQSGQVKGDATTFPSQPALSMQTVTETEPIPFQSTTQDDPNLPPGQKKILTAGTEGVETDTYTITYANGEVTSKMLLSKVVSTPPVNQVVAIGTVAALPPSPPQQPSAAAATLNVQITTIVAVNNRHGVVRVKTMPDATLTITIVYCDGTQPTSLSLYQIVNALQDGSYMWAWLPKTDAKCASSDNNTVTVNASWNGQTATASENFAIQ